MKKADLENKISNATSSLIDMASDICWNKISRNCEYIMSEIDESIGENFTERAKIRKKVNDEKLPKTLNEIIIELNIIFENLYDINLYIYKSLPDKTIVEIRYFLKTSHSADFLSTIMNNEPMLHCKVARPPYITKSQNSTKPEKKFDINWELGGIRHEWNKFLGKCRYYLYLTKRKRKQLSLKLVSYFYAYLLFTLWLSMLMLAGYAWMGKDINWRSIVIAYTILIPLILLIKRFLKNKRTLGNKV